MATSPKTTIALVGAGAEASGIDAALVAMPDIAVDRRENSLTRLNGTASELAATADVILFCPDPEAGLDLEVLRKLQRSPGRTAALVALTAPDMPISEARRLFQAGVEDVLPWTATPSELRDGLTRWRRPSLPAIYQPPPRQGRIVAVAQARGGIGSSTLAVNLADRLMDRKGLRRVARNRVVVVDLDLQFGSVASLLDAKENEALYQMAMDGTVPDGTFLTQALASTPGGLWLLSAPSKFAPLEALTAAQIGALLDGLAKQFDYVVVDLPRSLVHWVTAVLERTHRLMLVTDCAVPSIRQARRLLDLYLENNPALQVEVVMNQEHKPMIKSRHHVEASKLLERPFRHWLPFDPKAARKASDRGLPLSAVGGSALSKAVAALGRDTLAALAPQTSAQSRLH